MGVRVFVHYRPPADAETFEKRYLTEHLPILDRYTGMKDARFYRVSKTIAGEFPYTHTFTAEWDTPDAMMADMGSDAGREAFSNAKDIAPQGFDVVVVDTLSPAS